VHARWIIFFGPLADVVSVELILIVTRPLGAVGSSLAVDETAKRLTAEVEENIPPLKAI
jgi:hypothetical protein